jgi:DNA polymerase IIIc chi subunit
MALCRRCHDVLHGHLKKHRMGSTLEDRCMTVRIIRHVISGGKHVIPHARRDKKKPCQKPRRISMADRTARFDAENREAIWKLVSEGKRRQAERKIEQNVVIPRNRHLEQLQKRYNKMKKKQFEETNEQARTSRKKAIVSLGKRIEAILKPPLSLSLKACPSAAT